MILLMDDIIPSFIIRLLINSYLVIMKPAHLQREEKDEDSDDSFDLKEWKKSKTQQIAQPTKKTASDLDGKKTRKYKDDPVMNQIYEKILRESDKFQEQIEKQQEVFQSDLYQYNPHIVSGKLENIRKLSVKDKEQWGLGDQGQCHAMEISEKITVVLVGKFGYEPIEGINANIYLPKETYQAIADKSRQKQSQRLVRLNNNRFGIWIKRQLRKDGTSNILSYPYLVIDPQNLLYPSYLCSWISCQRSISLSHYVQGEKQVNQAIVYGSTCHRLLEWLAEHLVTVQQYQKSKQDLLKRLYNSMLYDMYLIDRSYEQFMSVCLQRLDNLVNFYHRYIEKGEEMQVDRYKKLYLKIQKLISSQYMFRSNFFGLKGKVDLLLAGQMIDKKKGTSQQVYIPMQLKTGRKVSDSHKRQTQIYNILVRQKYKKSVVGLLYYSDSDIRFFKIEDPLSAFEIILVHRNQIALNLVKLFQSSSIKLPQLAYGFPQCNFCYYSPICQLSYTKIEQRDIQDIEQLPSKYHKNLKSAQQIYSPADSQYITKWFKMIHQQETQFKKINTDYWKMGISSFRLEYTELTNLNKPQTKARLQLIHRCKKQEQLSIFQDFYKISMKVRMVANTINLIEGCKIISAFREASTKQFHLIIEMNNQSIEYSPNKLIFFIQQQQDVDVDIQTFENSSFASMRSTVLGIASNQTFLKDLIIENKIKKQIIDLSDSDQQEQSTRPKIQLQENDYLGFNQDQKKAFKKAVLQTRFCLIEGMPGTGKTQLIIRLIQKFHKDNKTILITTFTNRALDNILQRLLESDKVDKECIIRQGSQYSCSKLLKQFTSHSRKFTTLQDYKKYYGTKKIWFVTLSSLYIHHLPKMFDITILDEASQCLEPVCIEGLLKARKFVLIGDYKQLQPVVKSKEAFKKGMCISLFERLCKAFPVNTVALKKQYRMNNKIMALSNKLVYNGQLQLAIQKNRQKVIKLNQSWQQNIPLSFLNIISPQNSIVFLNYDPIIDSITKKYRQKQPTIRKIIEGQLSVFIYSIFISLGFPQSNISIIAAMNSSVNKIIELLRQSKTLSQNNGSILTIDKSQGIDKQIIILLIQRGNQDLIQNPRRLNVALTRAKSKLIIIGSDQQLSKMKIWQGTLGKMLREYQIELNKSMIQDMITHIEKKQ